jgi:hypothetical protein
MLISILGQCRCVGWGVRLDRLGNSLDASKVNWKCTGL